MKNFLPVAAVFAAAFFPFGAAAVTAADVYGEYEWSYEDVLWGGVCQVTVTLSEGSAADKVNISGLYLDNVFEATLDEEKGTLSIPYTELPDVMDGVALCKVVWDSNNGRTVETTPLVGTYTDGSFVFADNEGLGVGLGEYDMWFTLVNKMKFEPKVDRTFKYDEAEWTVAGTAEFGESWLCYHLMGSTEAVVRTVDVAVNNTNKNRIALINPYGDEVWAEYNADPVGVGHIVIDLSDPTCVILEPYVYSGFTHKTYGKIYAYNYEGNYSFFQNMDNESIKAHMQSNQFETTTFVGNTIYMPATAIVATESNPSAMYGWAEMDGTIVLDEAVMAAISTTGLGSVDAADTEVVKYYNLQGMEVKNPAKGLYIIRQGNKVSRKYIR